MFARPPWSQLLTTDAIPDPPRVLIEGPGPNPDPPKHGMEQKSAPVTPEPEAHRLGEMIPVDIQSQRSGCNPSTYKPEPSKPQNFDSRPKTTKDKTKSKSTKSKRLVYTVMSQDTHVTNIINSNNVHVGDTNIFKINQFSKDVTPEGRVIKPMSKKIKQLSSCKEEISINDMILIKTHIGHGWRDVARKLGYSEGQIQQFDENHKYKGTNEVVYQLLLDWKRANTKDAQLGNLVCIMWSCHEYDCVNQLLISRQTST